MKPLLISSGEPAGIGPDLCLALAVYQLPVVIVADKNLLAERAKQLGMELDFRDYQAGKALSLRPNQLNVLNLNCPAKVITGQLNPSNASYVLEMLGWAIDKCLAGEFSALVTAPVHKAVINQAGIPFSGHTEFLAARCQAKNVVMMLASELMKVALITTHLPLKDVPPALNQSLIIDVIEQLCRSLQNDFNILNPCIYVAGLNPHAGESGYLGQEEIEIINPALALLREKGIDVQGAFPADTLFSTANLKHCDAFVTMYHDQGLPVLKYASFGSAVNITLGLPIIRTSVDHGTALELAGSGKADSSSLLAAIKMAYDMAQAREEKKEGCYGSH